MRTKEGYAKKTLGSKYLLRADGGHVAINSLFDVNSADSIYDKVEGTGIYATTGGNEQEATFYFAAVKINKEGSQGYDTPIQMRFVISAEVPGRTDYNHLVDIKVQLVRNSIRSLQTVSLSSASSMYYFRIRKPDNQTSYDKCDGYYLLGISIIWSSNYTNTSYKRNIKVHIIEQENCTIIPFDTFYKIYDLYNCPNFRDETIVQNNTTVANPGFIYKIKQYSSSTAYTTGDTVYYSNNLYRCKANVTGGISSSNTYWQLITNATNSCSIMSNGTTATTSSVLDGFSDEATRGTLYVSRMHIVAQEFCKQYVYGGLNVSGDKFIPLMNYNSSGKIATSNITISGSKGLFLYTSGNISKNAQVGQRALYKLYHNTSVANTALTFLGLTVSNDVKYKELFIQGTYNSETDEFVVECNPPTEQGQAQPVPYDGSTVNNTWYKIVPTLAATVTANGYNPYNTTGNEFLTGKYYMHVGYYSSDPVFSLNVDNPIYYFDGTKLMPWEEAKYLSKSYKATVDNLVTISNDLVTLLYDFTTSANYSWYDKHKGYLCNTTNTTTSTSVTLTVVPKYKGTAFSSTNLIPEGDRGRYLARVSTNGTSSYADVGSTGDMTLNGNYYLSKSMAITKSSTSITYYFYTSFKGALLATKSIKLTQSQKVFYGVSTATNMPASSNDVDAFINEFIDVNATSKGSVVTPPVGNGSNYIWFVTPFVGSNGVIQNNVTFETAGVEYKGSITDYRSSTYYFWRTVSVAPTQSQSWTIGK